MPHYIPLKGISLEEEIYKEAEVLAKALNLTVEQLIDFALIDYIQTAKAVDRKEFSHLRG